MPFMELLTLPLTQSPYDRSRFRSDTLKRVGHRQAEHNRAGMLRIRNTR